MTLPQPVLDKINAALADGTAIDTSRRTAPLDEKPKLVPMAFLDRISEQVWTLPIVTASEANGRDWRARSNRTKQARDVVAKAFGPAMLDDYLMTVASATGPDWMSFGEDYGICLSGLTGIWRYQDDEGIERVLPTPCTRGELRRLCKALGVELKETT